jgi:O-antigen/teichoic acid export membrane protein
MRAPIYLLTMHLGVEALALGRNIIIARLLGPAEMGRATLLAVTLRMLEMASDCATDRLLIQATDGNRPSMQATAQGIEILRGGISGLLVLSLGAILPVLIESAPSLAAFTCLAVIPMLKGFVHLDFRRQQRKLEFRSAALVELSASLVSLVAIWPLTQVFSDYRIVLMVACVQAMAFVTASHLLAVRPYRVRWEHKKVSRFIAFGWPLAMNGLLMFLVFQGDRFLVAASCSAAELGRYAVAFQLSLLPVLILSRIGNSVFLPILSPAKADAVRFRSELKSGTVLTILLSILVGVGVFTFEESVIAILYGPEFVVSSGLIVCLALMHSARLLRTMPSVAAVARGDSVQPLLVNLVRAFGVLAAGIVAFQGMGLTAIAAAGCAGEIVALLFSFGLIHRRLEIPHGFWRCSAMLSSVSLLVLTLGLCGVLGFSWGTQYRLLLMLGVALLTLTILLLNQRVARDLWAIVQTSGGSRRQAADIRCRQFQMEKPKSDLQKNAKQSAAFE